MIRRIMQHVMAMAAITLCLASPVLGDILVDGEPNIDDERLYAWYDGNEAIGADGIDETPYWPNKQGDELRDITSAFGGADATLGPVPTLNGNFALEYVDAVTWADQDNWGSLEDQFTIFVAAIVYELDSAYFFTGNQGGGGTEANANFQTDDPDVWSIKAEERVQTAPLVLEELQYHAFTFTEDGDGLHHIDGDLVGEGEVGIPSLQGFVLGGRQNGFERATADFAEVLIYDEALVDADRQAIESYLDNKFFGTSALVGDYNNDGELNAPDLNLQAIEIVADPGDPAFDLNEDGVVDYEDRKVWVNDLKKTWIGDSNLDLEFNSSDMVQVFVQGKYEKNVTAGWEDGDWDGDIAFDSSDMVAAFVGGGYEKGPPPVDAVSAVPEPSTTSLLLLGLLSLGAPFRRRA